MQQRSEDGPWCQNTEVVSDIYDPKACTAAAAVVYIVTISVLMSEDILPILKHPLNKSYRWCSRLSFMKLSANDANVCNRELAFVRLYGIWPFWTPDLSGRWTTVGISCKRYHLVTMAKSSAASTSRSFSSDHALWTSSCNLHSVLHIQWHFCGIRHHNVVKFCYVSCKTVLMIAIKFRRLFWIFEFYRVV